MSSIVSLLYAKPAVLPGETRPVDATPTTTITSPPSSTVVAERAYAAAANGVPADPGPNTGRIAERRTNAMPGALRHATVVNEPIPTDPRSMRSHVGALVMAKYLVDGNPVYTLGTLSDLWCHSGGYNFHIRDTLDFHDGSMRLGASPAGPVARDASKRRATGLVAVDLVGSGEVLYRALNSGQVQWPADPASISAEGYEAAKAALTKPPRSTTQPALTDPESLRSHVGAWVMAKYLNEGKETCCVGQLSDLWAHSFGEKHNFLISNAHDFKDGGLQPGGGTGGPVIRDAATEKTGLFAVDLVGTGEPIYRALNAGTISWPADPKTFSPEQPAKGDAKAV